MSSSRTNVKVDLYTGCPGTGKSYKLRELYQGFITQYVTTQQTNIIVLCPTNQLIQNYLQYNIKAKTLYNFLRLTPQNMKNEFLVVQQCWQDTQITNQNKQQHIILLIDEIFMISYMEMIVLYNYLISNYLIIEFYLFGDPFQLKAIGNDTNDATGQKFWYDVFYEFNIKINTNKLTTLHRFKEDNTLSKFIQQLTEYYKQLINSVSRGNQIINVPKLNIFEIISEEQLIKYIKQQYLIIVGVHSRRRYYQNLILKYYKQQRLIFSAKDGNIYYINQPIYEVGYYGTLQGLYYIKQYDQQTGEIISSGIGSQTSTQTKIFKPKTLKNKIQYNISPGDVLTVNVTQGREYNGVIIDMNSLFEYGSFYTAISRCKKVDQVKLINVTSLEFHLPDMQNEFIFSEQSEDS